MLIRKYKLRLRGSTRAWPGMIGVLLLCWQTRASAAWKENCQSHYDPLTPAPALPLALQNLEQSHRGDLAVLESQLRSLIITEAPKAQPIWNETATQDLARRIQDVLFQQKAQPAVESLRRHWFLLLLAQSQWDLLDAALKKSQSPLVSWMLAETRLGLRDYSEALRLFRLTPAENLQPWIDWRRMETLLLLGQSEGALEQLSTVLGGPLLKDGRVRESLQNWLQSFVARGQALPSLLRIVQQKADRETLGQVAFCVLTRSRDPEGRALALDSVLNLPQPDQQSLRLATAHVGELLVEPLALESVLKGLMTYADHAAARFRLATEAQSGEDALAFMLRLRRAGDVLMKSRSLRESPKLLERLDSLLQTAIAALPRGHDAKDLWSLRARVLEALKRPVEAAKIYRSLALKATSEEDQRLFANLMLQNFGMATADLATDDAFRDACRIYQRLVPDARQELSRCDLMMARQALQKGQETDALQQLWQIVYAFPGAVEGQTAAERLIELSRKSPDELYRTSEKLLNIRSFQTGPWGIKLKELRRESSFARITQLTSAHDQAEAYFIFSQKEKGDPLASRSLLLAVALDQKQGRLARALERLETWLHDYPEAPEAPARLLELVSLAERAFQIQKARLYLQWTSAFRWTSEQRDHIQQKTCLYDILERPLHALSSCETIGPHVPQGSLLRLRLARALAYGGYSEQLHAYARASLLPRQDLSVDQKIVVLDLLRRATILTPARDDDLRTTMTNYYLEQNESLGPESRRILGGLAYAAAQKTLAPFQALSIYGARSDELIGSIQAKKQAYDELEALYNKVLQTKDPHWGSSALCDLALGAENFAEALSKIPDIEGLDRKRPMSQIASQIAGWRAKAKSLSGAASKTIDRFGILHPDNPRVIQEARRLKDDPLQFHDWIPSLLEAESPVSRTSPWARWDEVSRALLDSSQRNAGLPSTALILQAINFTLQKRDFARAEWLTETLSQSPDPHMQALGLWAQGRLQARLDQFGQTEELWQKALALAPDHQDLRKQLGLLYARFGFFAKALQLLKPIEDEAQVGWTLVAMERQLELNEPADHRCEGLLAATRPPAAAFYNCSLLEFQNHRNAAKAISWMETALHQAEDQPALAEAARQQLTLMQIWKAKHQADR